VGGDRRSEVEVGGGRRKRGVKCQQQSAALIGLKQWRHVRACRADVMTFSRERERESQRDDVPQREPI